MRPDLFFFGVVCYRVDESDAALLLAVLQKAQVVPGSLRKSGKTGEIRFCLSCKHAKVFEHFAKEDSLTFLSKEKGVPVLLRGLLRAPGLLVGLLLSVLLLLGAHSVVWDIRITGTEALSNAELEQALMEVGVFRGAPLSSLDGDDIALSLREKEPCIGYAAVNLSGTVVHVQIRESEPVPVPNSKSPANLVAARDGVITMPLVFEGECLVEVGEVVRAGQILVGGVRDTQNHGYRITRAAGQVLARTVHTYTVRVPFSYEEKVYVGEKKCGFSLLFFQFVQKVFKIDSQKHYKCDIIEEIKYFRTPTGATLPFGYRLETALFYEMQSCTRDMQTARSEAQSELARMLAAGGAERTLLEKHVEWSVDSEGVTLVCTVVCEEDIARTVEFSLQS